MSKAIEALLARTRIAANRRSETIAAEYATLVEDAARGSKELDAERLVEWLEENRFSVAEFHAAVQHRAARLSAAAALAAKPAAEKKLAAADAKLATLNAAHDTKIANLRADLDTAVKNAEAAFASISAPHVADRTNAATLIDAANEAAFHLIETASSELKTEVANAHAHIATASAQITKLSGDLARAEAKARSDRPALIADAEYRGERTFGEEVNKFTGEVGRSHTDAAKIRVEENKKRFVAEALARVEKGLQKIRDEIDQQHRVAASWQAEIARVELEMLVVV